MGLRAIFFDAGNTLPKVNGKQNHMYLLLPDQKGSVAYVIDHDSSEVVERAAYMPYGAFDADFRPRFRPPEASTAGFAGVVIDPAFRQRVQAQATVRQKRAP